MDGLIEESGCLRTKTKSTKVDKGIRIPMGDILVISDFEVRGLTGTSGLSIVDESGLINVVAAIPMAIH